MHNTSQYIPIHPIHARRFANDGTDLYGLAERAVHVLKRWRGEESPSVYGGEDVKVSPTSGFTPKKLLNLAA